MTFGEKLAKLRKEKNLTQEQLADILKVSRQSVSKWESDLAYPETDKLISLANLFDCSTDYLLKDDCAAKSENHTQKAVSELPTKHQKIIGYILLTVSLIAGILTILLAENDESLFITLIISVCLFCCSLICLFVKEYAGYWCVWAGFAPLISLSPAMIITIYIILQRLVILPFYVIMFFVAGRVFNKEVETSRKKTRLLIAAWILFVGLISLLYVVSPFGGTDILINLLWHGGMALLLTYTVCYLKSIKK